jgi:hypothetical protein
MPLRFLGTQDNWVLSGGHTSWQTRAIQRKLLPALCGEKDGQETSEQGKVRFCPSSKPKHHALGYFLHLSRCQCEMNVYTQILYLLKNKKNTNLGLG